MLKYLLIFFCILLTVYAQLIFKWRVSSLKLELSNSLCNKINVVLNLILDPYVISGYISAFTVSILWIFVLQKFQLSYAYAFMALPFIFVPVAAYFLFDETMDLLKIFGYIMIFSGLVCISLSR